MSIRAHLKQRAYVGDGFIDYVSYSNVAFNLWYDEDFMRVLQDVGLLSQLDEDNCGDLRLFEEDLNKIKESWNEIKKYMRKDRKQRVEEIIQKIERDFASRKGLDGELIYYCF